MMNTVTTSTASAIFTTTTTNPGGSENRDTSHLLCGEEEKGMCPYFYTLEKAPFKHQRKKYVLERGDAVYFDSGVRHSGSSIGKKKAKLLSVMFNYKRI